MKFAMLTCFLPGILDLGMKRNHLRVRAGSQCCWEDRQQSVQFERSVIAMHALVYTLVFRRTLLWILLVEQAWFDNARGYLRTASCLHLRQFS